MRSIVLTIFLITTNAWANLHLAPPDFNDDRGRSVFVDFLKAEYSVTYDLNRLTTTVKSRITFRAAKRGRPLFDLVPEPWGLRLNGEDVGQELTTFPGDLSTLRVLDVVVAPGVHVLELENELKTNVSYRGSAVASAFWIRDLKDRKFLEQYVPSNFEFDQYPVVLDFSILGVTNPKQDIYTNGKLSQTSSNSWRIEFPDYFTVSCHYFHLTPRGEMSRRQFVYRSVDGRDLAVTIYSPFRFRTKKFSEEAVRFMRELENDYGPWPHQGLVAYGTMPGTGGMEHAGATATSLAALDHEMLHSYFAKGVMPANGNSGWLDEAIAAWRDRGYQRLEDPGFEGSNIGGRSVYARNTDDRSYALGSAFMGYLDYRLAHMGGLKAFLRGYAQTYKHQVVTTEHFKNNLEFFGGINLDQEFGTYIWGKNTQSFVEESHRERIYHRHLSERELESLL